MKSKLFPYPKYHHIPAYLKLGNITEHRTIHERELSILSSLNRELRLEGDNQKRETK